jgi:hypothetical protein
MAYDLDWRGSAGDGCWSFAVEVIGWNWAPLR